jgi:hypothetical protein
VTDDEQPTAEFDQIRDLELPRDPDLDHVPSDLQLLAGLGPTVTVVDEDGVSHDQLVIVPGLFGAARRLEEED